MKPTPLLVALLLCLGNASAQQTKITIDQGYLSKNSKSGAKAHIWAQPNTATRFFAGWIGNVQYLLDPQAPCTTFTVPTIDINLRATYRTVPAWTVQILTVPNTAFGNILVSYTIPPNATRLVFDIHGSGGHFRPPRPRPDHPTSSLACVGNSNGGFFSHFSSQVIWAAVSISSLQGPAFLRMISGFGAALFLAERVSSFQRSPVFGALWFLKQQAGPCAESRRFAAGFRHAENAR